MVFRIQIDLFVFTEECVVDVLVKILTFDVPLQQQSGKISV